MNKQLLLRTDTPCSTFSWDITSACLTMKKYIKMVSDKRYLHQELNTLPRLENYNISWYFVTLSRNSTITWKSRIHLSSLRIYSYFSIHSIGFWQQNHQFPHFIRYSSIKENSIKILSPFSITYFSHVELKITS